MSIILYAKGDTHIENGIRCIAKKFDPHTFEPNLKAGWFLRPEDVYKDKKPDEAISDEQEKPIEENDEQEINEEGRIRLLAKDRGIKSWHRKSIDKLKKELSKKEEPEEEEKLDDSEE